MLRSAADRSGPSADETDSPRKPAAAPESPFWRAQPTFGPLLGVVFALVLGVALLLAWRVGLYEISEEGRILERTQEVLLGMNIAVLLVAAVRTRGAPRMLFVGMATVSVVIFMRELGLEPDSPLDRLVHATSFRIVQTLIVLGVGVGYVVMRPHYLVPIGRYMISWQSRYIYLVIALILLGDIVEKLDKYDILQPPVGLYGYMFVEEILELWAYLAFLFVGLFCLAHGSTPPVSEGLMGTPTQR